MWTKNHEKLMCLFLFHELIILCGWKEKDENCHRSSTIKTWSGSNRQSFLQDSQLQKTFHWDLVGPAMRNSNKTSHPKHQLGPSYAGVWPCFSQGSCRSPNHQFALNFPWTMSHLEWWKWGDPQISCLIATIEPRKKKLQMTFNWILVD